MPAIHRGLTTRARKMRAVSSTRLRVRTDWGAVEPPVRTLYYGAVGRTTLPVSVR